MVVDDELVVVVGPGRGGLVVEVADPVVDVEPGTDVDGSGVVVGEDEVLVKVEVEVLVDPTSEVVVDDSGIVVGRCRSGSAPAAPGSGPVAPTRDTAETVAATSSANPGRRRRFIDRPRTPLSRWPPGQQHEHGADRHLDLDDVAPSDVRHPAGGAR